MTAEISSSEINMGECFSGGYDAVVMSERSASGIGGKNRAFKASALSKEVVAFPEGVTSVGIDGGVGGR